MTLFVLLLAFLGSFNIQENAVLVSARPAAIYIEKASGGQQRLNFDFALQNTTSQNLRLQKVLVSVFDRQNKLVLRKFIDGNGVRPSIETVSNRALGAKSTALIFNPFHEFSSEIELYKLAYEFAFESEDRQKTVTAKAEVFPVLYNQKTNLVLPVAGRSIIYDGHDFYSHHRRFDYLFEPIRAFGFSSNFMRYSYDFAPVNADGEMFSGDEKSNQSYFGFGADLFAAGGGRVVSVVDDKPDNRSFDETELKSNQSVLFGNYVVIDHLNGEFSLYAHLKQGSSRVRAGETVKQNQVIGQIGASGSANFPHLHYELQNAADTNAEGLPSYFRNFRRVLGSRTQAARLGQIDSGDIVER